MRSMSKVLVYLLGVLLLTASVAYAQGKDVEGSKDHPLISRFAGSVIKFYDVKQFDEYVLPLGKAVGEFDEEKRRPVVKLTESKRLEGKVTRIFYEAPEGRSTLEIYRSYESALKKAGFEILFSGAGEELGRFFDRIIYPERRLSGRCWIIDVKTRPQRYLAARLSRPEGEVYISLYTSLHTLQYGPGDVREDWPAINLVVVEIRPMEVGLVTAGTMLGDIAKVGHVAIYGIHFDFGKADVKPESDPVLKEIASLLQQNPNLKLHVVGHTDNVGDLTYNMKLSQGRADAVVKEIISKYGIDANRLKAHGVGPLSPMASNKTEEGRAKNRRVELVERQ
ncbi:OmpA family protein [Thermodesulfovibrionales bacterium]|nr:OmpA family protein [Thermodesulfovibrionales bacterium]